MPTDSGTNDILSLGFLHYTTAVSREMSDEPYNLNNKLNTYDYEDNKQCLHQRD